MVPRLLNPLQLIASGAYIRRQVQGLKLHDPADSHIVPIECFCDLLERQAQRLKRQNLMQARDVLGPIQTPPARAPIRRQQASFLIDPKRLDRRVGLARQFARSQPARPGR
ncbi:hypothetical protein D3C80_1491840 [compost metagenome]